MVTCNRLLSDQQNKIVAWLGVVVIGLIALGLGARYLWLEPFSYDEGHWLMFGALANAGHEPYRVTFVGIPPLALLTIQLGARLFGITLAARYPMMFLSVLGVISLYLSFRPWRRQFYLVGGFLAAVLLLSDIDYLQGTGSIMAEAPAVSLALISFVLAQQFATGRHVYWLVLSGAAFGLSLALKIFMVFIPALVSLMILLRLITHRPKSRIEAVKQPIVAGLAWLLGAATPWLLFFMIYDPVAMYEQIFLFRLAFREISQNEGITLLGNAEMVLQMLIQRWPLLLGTALGVIIAWRRRWPHTGSWLAWFVLALFPLVWQAPLRERYAVMFLPPLAVFTAIALTTGLFQITVWLKKRNISQQTIHATAALLLFGLVAWFLTPPVYGAYRDPSPDTFPDLNLDAVQYIWKNSMANDCIVTDDQRIAFAANRLVPVALSETAIGRLATGWLTTEDVIEQIQKHDCPIVVYADWRFAEYLPHLDERLEELYFIRIPFDDENLLYTAKKNNTRPPTTPLLVEWRDELALKGIDLTQGPWYAGQNVRLATYWTALKPVPQSYKFFLQLRDSRDRPVINFDHFPFAAPPGEYHPELNIDDLTQYSVDDVLAYPDRGMAPTEAWPVGNIIREVTFIELPPDLPSGAYHLYLGFYNPITQLRTSVTAGAAPDDEFLVTSIEIVNPN